MNSLSLMLNLRQAYRVTEIANQSAELSQFLIQLATSSLSEFTGRRHQRRDAPRALQWCLINLSDVWY